MTVDVRSFRPGEFELTAPEEGHLVGSSCAACGAHYYPAREVCARCLNEDLERVPLSRRGTLYTYTVVRQSTPAFTVPYVLGYVDLPEGARVMAQIADVDGVDIELGIEVELITVPWGESDDGTPLMGFRFRPVRRDEQGGS